MLKIYEFADCMSLVYKEIVFFLLLLFCSLVHEIKNGNLKPPRKDLLEIQCTTMSSI